MLNYIKAELWKVSRQMSFYMVTGVLLFCAHLFGLLFAGGSFHQLVSGMCTTMLTGVAAAPMLVQLVDKGFGGTLRNEVSFGLSREMIYLGKLFSIFLVGLALCAVLIGGVLLSGWVFLGHDSAQKELVALAVLAFCLTAALPVWCGMAGLCHMLATLFRSEVTWISLYFLALIFLEPIVATAGLVFTGDRLNLAEPSFFHSALMPWTLLFSQILDRRLTLRFLLRCWTVGLGWLAGTSAVGMLFLRRRDAR